MTSQVRIVVFTGAGVSQESGLATFRGPGGLWESFRPEQLATVEAFQAHPEVVWRWYRWRFERVREARPNPAHVAIASWESEFPFLVVVTQNVDRLHQRAGSRDVLELHGTIWEAHCERCGARAPMEEVAVRDEPIPRCVCGGALRPSVVWFGEMLPDDVFARATLEAQRADLFLVVGTSAVVYPAAALIEVAAAAGAHVIEVNRDDTALSGLAHRRVRGLAGETLPGLTEEIRAWARARS